MSGDPGAAAVTRRIKERALELGFAAAGVAAVTETEAGARYEAWLALGRHGGMDWLATPRNRARRGDPGIILPGCRSILCVALCHEPGRDEARDDRLGRIARYAAGEDYHRMMRDLLEPFERFVQELLPGSRALWYSDTGAILERSWAERAGLGWIGRHSGLISPTLGSYLLLGEVLIRGTLVPDEPFGAATGAREHCGTCARCLEACPTRAIVAPHEVDARRCISYLTIEHRGIIPHALRPLVGDWIFGCDVCQEVCPWNRFAPPAREARLHARSLDGWTLERFLTLDEEGFRALFAGSPIRRAGRAGFLRNVCVALGNRGDPAAVPALEETLARDPEALPRAHAAWALGEIGRELAADGVEPAVRDIEGALEGAIAGDPAEDVRIEASVALSALDAGGVADPD